MFWKFCRSEVGANSSLPDVGKKVVRLRGLPWNRNILVQLGPW